jgi:N-acetylglucosamine-6-sulfatase
VAAHDGVRTANHKLFYLPATKEWQLFDLQQDPMEMRSVHDDPAYAGRLAELKDIYQQLRARYRVPQG